MAELDPRFAPLVDQMAAFLADQTRQTVEAANTIRNDPLYMELQRTQPTNETFLRFMRTRNDMILKVTIGRLKDELKRRQSSR